MPHLFANRERRHDLTRRAATPRDHFRWETINAVTYLIGGGIFVAGSVLFFPQLAAWANLGAWLFVLGSLAYLVVNIHDLGELARHRREGGRTPGLALEATAALVYFAGTLLFVAGSLFFLSWVGWTAGGAWCFVVGSLLFLIGASVNVLQIVRQCTMATLQLTNLTAITFIAGSLLFAVASVPYLWSLDASADRETLFTFLAWQFVVGSLLFTLGGLFNYARARLVMLGLANAPHTRPGGQR